MRTPPLQVHPRRPAQRSRLFAGFAAAVALSLLPSAAPASAARGDDSTSLQELQRRREQVRRDRAAQAGQVSALEGTDAQVADALAALNANVNAQQDRLDFLERRLAR